MRSILSFIILCFVVSSFFSCQEEEQFTPKKGTKTTSSGKNSEKLQKRVSNYDSLLQVILLLENTITVNPVDQQLRERLLATAHDTEAGIFYCAGKGIVNPKHHAAVQKQGMRKAARHTGERWFLYLKAWQEERTISFDKKIAGRLLTVSTLLYEKIEQDTLYQLLSIPSDSIQLQ